MAEGTGANAPRRKDQQRVEAALRARLEEIERLKQFEQSTTFAGDQREAFGELSLADQHPADVADQTFQRELDATILGVLEQEEQQLRDAIERHSQGTYGLCARCGRQIDPARLEARPEAALCIDCQREVEAGR